MFCSCSPGAVLSPVTFLPWGSLFSTAHLHLDEAWLLGAAPYMVASAGTALAVGLPLGSSCSEQWHTCHQSCLGGDKASGPQGLDREAGRASHMPWTLQRLWA